MRPRGVVVGSPQGERHARLGQRGKQRLVELVAIDIAKVRDEVLIEASGQKRRRRLSVSKAVQSMIG